MKDLIVLVADKNMEQTVQGLLSRHQSLKIRCLDYDVFVHPRRDPGCLNESHDFLRPFAVSYAHALVMFDREGCGRDQFEADILAQKVRNLMAANGWSDRAEVIVIDPELDKWVWSNSPHVAACLGWAGSQPPLRDWLAEKGHWQPEIPKPHRPKEAMEAALRRVGKPRSSAIYLELAQRVSLQGHTEPAFLHFTDVLQKWFSL